MSQSDSLPRLRLTAGEANYWSACAARSVPQCFQNVAPIVFLYMELVEISVPGTIFVGSIHVGGENSRAEDENSRPIKWHTLLGAAQGVKICLGYTASCQALCSEPCSKRPLFEESSQLTNFGIERRDLS